MYSLCDYAVTSFIGYSASSLPDPQLDVADTPSPTLDPTEDSTEATEGVTEMFVSGPATPEIPVSLFSTTESFLCHISELLTLGTYAQ